MRLAIAHDYLVQMGGAERVVEVFHHMYPTAPIFTTMFSSQKLPGELRNADIRATWLQKMPLGRKNFKGMLPLYPLAIRDFDFTGFDVVLSSSSAFMKSIKVPRETFHLCYCHTPMRFAWDYDAYMERQSKSNVFKRLLKIYMHRLQRWDARTSSNVNQFVANSSIVKRRIESYYQRDSEVIFPPINTSRFSSSETIGNYYLIVSRLVSYKRIDLAVETFNRNGLPLCIVGEGPDLQRLRQMALPNVRFLGRLDDDAVTGLMAQCRALIFPGEEDFGMTPLEVNAAGRPVVAYKAGGALDTIVPYVNGVYFERQEVEHMMGAIRELESYAWDVRRIVSHAQQFDERRFMDRFKTYLEQAYVKFRESR